MSSILQDLDSCLTRLIAEREPPARYAVAFSGGIDSTVLLHALNHIEWSIPILAIHVDHQLCEQSAAWASHCEAVADSLGIEYVVRRADITDDTGMGPEAAARAARYGIFESLMQENDWLLSAHHQSDQAETLLLNLFRGSGPAGLSGIGTSRPFANGRLVRPLLGVAKTHIEEYARQENLSWIEDPSNRESRFDRNFLRNDILPRIESRWPSLIGRLTRSAELAGEASDLLDVLARIDLQTAGAIEKLEIDALGQLTQARQRNLLRYVIRQLGLPTPPSTRLSQIVEELIGAREDAQPLVSWTGAEVRRYRDKVYLLAAGNSSTNCDPASLLRAGSSVDLGAGLGSLSIKESDRAGIDPDVVSSGLNVCFRKGGETIRPIGRDHEHKLKKLLQDAAIVPWMRGRIPLLFSNDCLIAVADIWVAADFSADKGYQVTWENRPPIQ